MANVTFCSASSVVCILWLAVSILPNFGLRDQRPSPTLGFSPSIWKPCGGVEHMCKCKSRVADCSNNPGKLTFIPSFPRRVKTLEFASNNLTSISTSSFFENVTSVTRVDLSYNLLQFASDNVSQNAFAALTNLSELCLEGNSFSGISPFKFRTLFAPLRWLRFLSIGHTNFYSTLRDGILGTLKNLTELWMNNNFIVTIPEGAFSELKHLTDLRLDNNAIISVSDGAFSALGRLVTLRLENNYIDRISSETFSGLFYLRTLRLDDNLVEDIADGAFSDFRNLTTLRLDDNYIESISDKSFDGLGCLKTLRLDDNGLNEISEGAFCALKHLTTLRLDDNVLEVIPDELFAALNNLTTLRLDDNHLTAIPDGTFRNCRTLTTIRLDDNTITEIPQGLFDGLERLTELRLDDNLIETVSENTFSPATRSRLQSLNLSHNPFQCTCSLLWFRNWAMSSQSLFDFQNDDSVYECKNLIPDTDLAAFIMNEQQCLLGHDAYVFTVVCTGVLISTITVMTLLFRYRWHVRLRVYEAFRGSPHARPKERDPADFQFDLFVSYDSEDSPWVVRHLVPVLEQQLGLRLCVHQRDFIPGKNIVENIVDSLASSRRVLAIFSPSFAESRWCHFELEMCLSHVIDNNDVMVIVILQHVPSRDMSGAMLALVKTTTYIEWVEDPDAIASFWRRLTLALRDILPGV